MLFFRKSKQISRNLFHEKLHIFLLKEGGGLIKRGGGGLDKFPYLKRGLIIREGDLLERERLIREGAY